eukprot:scpid56469/ scgid17636/ 
MPLTITPQQTTKKPGRWWPHHVVATVKVQLTPAEPPPHLPTTRETDEVEESTSAALRSSRTPMDTTTEHTTSGRPRRSTANYARIYTNKQGRWQHRRDAKLMV